jgi:hypothetical protein
MARSWNTDGRAAWSLQRLADDVDLALLVPA